MAQIFAALKNFSPDKLSKNEKLLLTGVCVFAVLFFLDRFAVQSIQEKSQQLKEEIRQQQLIYQHRMVLIKNKQKIQSSFVNHKRYLQTKEGSDEDSLADIFSYLESLSRKNELTLVDVKPNSETIESAYFIRYPVEVEIEAGLDNLLRFFYDLSEGVPMVDVSKVTIEAKGDTMETKIDLEAIIFKKEPQKTGGVDAARKED